MCLKAGPGGEVTGSQQQSAQNSRPSARAAKEPEVVHEIWGHQGPGNERNRPAHVACPLKGVSECSLGHRSCPVYRAPKG